MAVPRVSVLRQASCGVRVALQHGQRRHAQVQDVRFFAVHAPKQNKYIDKYKSKLEQKAQQVGARDVDDLIHKSKEHFTGTVKPAASADSTSPFSQQYPIPGAPPPPPTPSQPAAGSSSQQQASPVSAAASAFKQKSTIKTLSSFLDVDKVSTLPSTEIEALWRLRHASNPRSLCASIPAPLFARIALTARKHPQFILPIPRTAAEDGQGATSGEVGDGSGGADIHFLQWTFPSPTTATVLFTHLAEYKTRGEYAAPHTTVTHHTDLAGDKNLVLLEGTVMPDRGVSVDEGKWLVMCLQKFYGAFEKESEERALKRSQLLSQFSSGDASFEVAKLLEETERIG